MYFQDNSIMGEKSGARVCATFYYYYFEQYDEDGFNKCNDNNNDE